MHQNSNDAFQHTNEENVTLIQKPRLLLELLQVQFMGVLEFIVRQVLLSTCLFQLCKYFSIVLMHTIHSLFMVETHFIGKFSDNKK